MVEFSQDELVDALLGAELRSRETPRSITVPEAARALGCAEAKARRLVRKAVRDGLLRAERIVRLNIQGSYQSVYGYVLTEKSGTRKDAARVLAEVEG